MDKHDRKHNKKHHHEHDHKEVASQHHASGLHIPGQPMPGKDSVENAEKPAPQADEKASRKDSHKEHRKHS